MKKIIMITFQCIVCFFYFSCAVTNSRQTFKEKIEIQGKKNNYFSGIIKKSYRNSSECFPNVLDKICTMDPRFYTTGKRQDIQSFTIKAQYHGYFDNKDDYMDLAMSEAAIIHGYKYFIEVSNFAAHSCTESTSYDTLGYYSEYSSTYNSNTTKTTDRTCSYLESKNIVAFNDLNIIRKGVFLRLKSNKQVIPDRYLYNSARTQITLHKALNRVNLEEMSGSNFKVFYDPWKTIYNAKDINIPLRKKFKIRSKHIFVIKKNKTSEKQKTIKEKAKIFL